MVNKKLKQKILNNEHEAYGISDNFRLEKFGNDYLVEIYSFVHSSDFNEIYLNSVDDSKNIKDLLNKTFQEMVNTNILSVNSLANRQYESIMNDKLNLDISADIIENSKEIYFTNEFTSDNYLGIICILTVNNFLKIFKIEDINIKDCNLSEEEISEFLNKYNNYFKN